MFREIRTSERITENSVVTATNYELMRLLDKRISNETIEEMKKLREREERKESKFDPDKRI